MAKSPPSVICLPTKILLVWLSAWLMSCGELEEGGARGDAGASNADGAGAGSGLAEDEAGQSSQALSAASLSAIRARSTERTILRDGNYESGSAGGRLLYERSETGRGGGELRNARRRGTPAIFTRVTATGESDGQCVAFVKTASGRTTSTSEWVKGAHAVSTCRSVVQGTAVATFAPDGTFRGHAGFVKSCNATSLTLWDQNFSDPPDGLVREHTIRSTNGSVADPRRYYVVLAP